MNIMKYLILLLLLTKIGLTQNEQIPIEISADKMEWDRYKSIAIAIGNAKAIQGKRIILAEKIIANINNASPAKEIVALEAIGNVRFFREGEEARGKEALYDLKKETIIIKGNVSLKKEDNIMLGEELLIDFRSGISQIEGSKNKNRVKMKYNSVTKKNDE